MRKKNVRGQCPLCRTDQQLIRSHIIPKFFWKPLKEDGGRYEAFSTAPEKGEYFGQKEMTEHLLCVHCDGVILQRYEDYLSRLIFQKAGPIENFGKYARLNELDYLKAKKALLSILWRMSVSRQKFFSLVDLGEYHTERLRALLISDDDIAEEDYPMTIIAPYLDNEHLGKLILEPTMVRVSGNRVYRCFITGFLFGFIVGSAPHSKEALHCNLKKDGSWLMGKRDVSEIGHLREVLKQVAKV